MAKEQVEVWKKAEFHARDKAQSVEIRARRMCVFGTTPGRGRVQCSEDDLAEPEFASESTVEMGASWSRFVLSGLCSL